MYRTCNADQLESITQQTLGEFTENDRFVSLNCGHVFDVDSLDQWMGMKQDNGSVGMKQCPDCKQVIYSNILRYKDELNKNWELIEKIKERMRQEITEAERREVMNAVDGRGNSFTAGHWFMCPNKHLYYIGECGGAMEVGVCPDCKSAVGGRNHALLPGQTHSTLDGSQQPQFPYGLHAQMGGR
eukprot:gene16309-19397_t